MAALNFQPLNLRPHCQPRWWSPKGEVRHNQSHKLATPGVSGCRRLCIRSQVSSVDQPPTKIENFGGLKAGGDWEHGQAQILTKGKTVHFNEDQKQWYKMMNEIRASEDAIPVLVKHKKAKKLTKESIIGTLMRLKQLRAWRSVMEICEWLMDQNWWQFGFEDYCLLMAAYGKEGQPEKAEVLLKRFSTAGYKSNIAMHTGLIEAYGRKKMYDKAESAIKSLLESGPAPTVPTYHTLMKAYTDDDRLEDAERIFSSMLRGEVKPDGRSYNLMIHAYGKAGMVDRAYELYLEMRELMLDISVFTFNTLISCQKTIKDAESIFRQMKAAKVRGDVVSYTTLMNAYGKAGKTEEAQDLFDRMLAYGIRPTRATYNVLLDAYGKANQVDEAEIVMKKMRKDKFTPTVHAFTTLVHGYALVGKMEKAEEILRRMKSESVEPNVLTYTAIMAGYASAKDMEKMVKKFNEMKTLGIKPNQAVYTVMIGACGLQEDFEASKFWFKEMVASGCEADSRARSAMMNASKTPDQLQEAVALIESCR